MNTKLKNDFDYIISYISPRLQMYLKKISDNVIEKIQEIRLRSDRPVVIVTTDGCCFLTSSGKISFIYSSSCVISLAGEITDTVNKMCGYSMHSHYEDILNGYITLPNGSRVGLCGTAVYDKENVKSIRNIDCINIRIPRYVEGVSEPLFESVFNKGLTDLIIAGPPSSGKTTMLKDIAIKLSSGRLGRYYKICVVDERKELFPRNNYNITSNIDVLLGFQKAKGIEMCVRTLSPDVIICDEIGSDGEADEIISGMNSGVCFILSIHAKSVADLSRKAVFKKLVSEGGIDKTLILKDSSSPCKIKSIINTTEVYDEKYIYNSDNRFDVIDNIYSHSSN